MNIDMQMMEKICLAKIKYFKNLGKVVDTRDGIYITRESPNSKILAVAHLDTVKNNKFFSSRRTKKDTWVTSPQLDDRLGVYTLLYLLPQLGIEYDLLLTEGEEVGRSTAAHFETEKKYNWMFSFDRRGEDVVTYDFAEKEWENELEMSGFTIGIGSFSDIAFLEGLGIKGVNVGTGYWGEHTLNCRASMNTLFRQIYKFQDFYVRNVDKKFPHVENYRNYRGFGFRSTSAYANFQYRHNPYYHEDLMGCYLCENGNGVEEIYSGIYLCPECFASAEVCQFCEDIVPNTEMIGGMCEECRKFQRPYIYDEWDDWDNYMAT